MKFDRLLKVYDLLPLYPRKLGVAELHKRLKATDVEFNVSLRTLQRDLLDLSSCYMLDVFSDGQPQAGWSKRPRFAALDGVAARNAANDTHYRQANRLC